MSDAAGFIRALEAAEAGADVIAALWEAIEGTGDPPTPEALAEWWPNLPDVARLETQGRLRKVGARTGADPAGFVREAFALWDALWWDDEPAPFPDDFEAVALALTRAWLALHSTDRDSCPAHPLAPIIRAWQGRPRPVYPERRREGRVPAVLAQARAGYGRPGAVLPRLMFDTAGGGQYSLLPGLGPEYDEYGGEFLAAALPVELYVTRGKGAPLDIRLGLEAILSVRPEDRRGHTVELGPWPWARWLKRTYPGRKVSQYAKRAWPGLRRALNELANDPRWRLPVSTGKGGWEEYHVVNPAIKPLTWHPSERILMNVTLPANAPRGGVTDRRLVRVAGARSTPALGLVTGLSVVWDRPGELRQNEAGVWVQNADVRTYPLIGWPGVVSLMYPGGPPKRKRWPQLEREARNLLDWLGAIEYVTWTREPGGRRIMPGADWPGWRPHQRSLIEAPR